MNTNTTIETRIPSAELFTKLVTSVSPKAKTGHDWDGGFLESGKLDDHAPGTLIVSVDNCGSKKNPKKDATLMALLPDGKWTTIDEAKSNEWAYDLRKVAIQFLDGDNQAEKAVRNAIARQEAIRATRVAKIEANKKAHAHFTESVAALKDGECHEIYAQDNAAIYKGTMVENQRTVYAAGCEGREDNREASLKDVAVSFEAVQAVLTKEEEAAAARIAELQAFLPAQEAALTSDAPATGKTVTTTHTEIGYTENVEIVEAALREKFGIDDGSFVLRAVAAFVWSNICATVGTEKTWDVALVRAALANVHARATAMETQLFASVSGIQS